MDGGDRTRKKRCALPISNMLAPRRGAEELEKNRTRSPSGPGAASTLHAPDRASRKCALEKMLPSRLQRPTVVRRFGRPIADQGRDGREADSRRARHMIGFGNDF